jgi:hypothetical protein
MLTSLTQIICESGERIPAKYRPGTPAYMRETLRLWKRLLRPGKFPAGMGSSGIYGVHRR